MKVSHGSKTQFFLSLLIAIMLVVTSIPMGAPARADDSSLTDLANVQITEILNGSVDLIQNPDAEVKYGDKIVVTMAWQIPDGKQFATTDNFTYVLPEEVAFTNASGNLDDGSRKLGTYQISGNVITINYFVDTFCNAEEDNRQGRLRFEGKITDNGEGGQPQQDIKVTFPVDLEYTLHMVPPDKEAKVTVDKKFADYDPVNHIYDCFITISADNYNTNVTLDDEMWPGMTLYSPLEFYTDSNYSVPLDPSRYTDNSPAPSDDCRFLNAVINSMDDGEVIYAKYQVRVFPEMYDHDEANNLVGNLRNYYPYLYDGNVPNRADVKSTEDPTVDTNWADIRTLRATFGKWGDPTNDDFENGLIGWNIAVYSTKGYGFSNGWIVDTLPKSSTLVESSIKVLADGGVMANGISEIRYGTDPESGKPTAILMFSSELMDYLDAELWHEVTVSYQTKVNEQSDEKDRYNNTAEIFYDGVSKGLTGSDVDYKKPDTLTKGVSYSDTSAPYATFNITVNPAALDLVSETDVLTLVDTMCSSYDLQVNSVKINGSAPANGVFTYDQATRTMTFNLKDKVRYDITYSAEVNLVPDTQFTDENSANSAMLYASATILDEDTSTLDCKVYESAGSSSSQVTGKLNIIKHDVSSVTSTLDDAEFTLSSMSYEDSEWKASNSRSDTTTDGSVSFGNLARGVIYMLKETAAPANYKKNDTPQFYAFGLSGTTIPSTIEYGGTTYPVTVIDASKVSYDVYFSNEPQTDATPTAVPTGAIVIKKSVQGLLNDMTADDIDNTTFVVKDSGGSIVWIGRLGADKRFDLKETNNYKRVYESFEIPIPDTSDTYTITEQFTPAEGKHIFTYYTLDGNTEPFRRSDEDRTAVETNSFSVDPGEVKTIEFSNTYHVYDVKIAKHVEGDGADTNKKFTIVVEFTPPADGSIDWSNVDIVKYPAQDGPDYTLDTTTNTLTCYVADGQYIKARNLPIGATYDATEDLTGVEGYTLREMKYCDTAKIVDDLDYGPDCIDAYNVYAKPTATATPDPTATATPEPTATATPVPTATATPVPTATATPVPTATTEPTPTATPVPTAAATATPVPTAEPTATATPKPTATPVPTATTAPTATPTGLPSYSSDSSGDNANTNDDPNNRKNATTDNDASTNSAVRDPASTPTPAPTATPTPVPPTATPTPVPAAPATGESGSNFVIVAIALCGVGLLAGVTALLLKKKKQ